MCFFIILGIMIVGLIGLPSLTTTIISMSRSLPYQTAFAQTQQQQQQQQLSSSAQLQQQHQRPPNILLIVGDDFGYSDIASFGSVISTPNLDALAKEGKILTNYHTVPVCSPARVALLTAVDHHIGGIGTMYELIAPNQIGMPGYETWINHRVVTVAELLRDAGYHTYLSGKWHLSGDHFEKGSFPSDRGFEKSLTLLNGGANHFNGYPNPPIEKITFAENGKIIPRPGNKTLYSNDRIYQK
jgi:arylsulfatase